MAHSPSISPPPSPSTGSWATPSPGPKTSAPAPVQFPSRLPAPPLTSSCSLLPLGSKASPSTSPGHLPSHSLVQVPKSSAARLTSCPHHAHPRGGSSSLPLPMALPTSGSSRSRPCSSARITILTHAATLPWAHPLPRRRVLAPAASIPCHPGPSCRVPHHSAFQPVTGAS